MGLALRECLAFTRHGNLHVFFLSGADDVMESVW